MSNYPANLPIVTPFPDNPNATMPDWQTSVFKPITDTIAALTGPGVWTPMTLLNGWTRYSVNWQYPSYRVMGAWVLCRGLITGGAGLIWATPAALMPTGKLRFVAGADPNNAASLILDPAAGLSVANYGTSGTNAYLALEQVSWMVE